MKIVYDYQAFSVQQYGGVSRYFYEIASRIANMDDYEVNILAGFYINKYLRKSSKELVHGWHIPPIRKTKIIFEAINVQLSKILLHTKTPNIVHETYYSRKRLAPKQSKTVITVLDMIHEKFGYLMPELGTDFPIVKAEAIKRADHIICISESTKKDLLNILDIAPEKVSTIYLGHTLQTNGNIKTIAKIKQPYILYVGARKAEYKNFKRLLQAYASSPKIRKNFSLVCCGHQSFSSTEIAIINQLGIDESKVIHLAGDDEILANLYTHASAFVYPSLYEGFGIPPLEAMSFGCPVICSNISSIPEVVGDAGKYFNPYEVDSIVDTLEKVLFSTEIPQELVNRGKNRVKNFSWEKCAEKTIDIYKSLL